MRHFPSPWHVEKIPGGYVVRDATGTAVSRVYGQDKPVEIQGVPRALTLDEARKMAMTIVNLPEVEMDREDGFQISPPRALGASSIGDLAHSYPSTWLGSQPRLFCRLVRILSGLGELPCARPMCETDTGRKQVRPASVGLFFEGRPIKR